MSPDTADLFVKARCLPGKSATSQHVPTAAAKPEIEGEPGIDQTEVFVIAALLVFRQGHVSMQSESGVTNSLPDSDSPTVACNTPHPHYFAAVHFLPFAIVLFLTKSKEQHKWKNDNHLRPRPPIRRWLRKRQRLLPILQLLHGRDSFNHPSWTSAFLCGGKKQTVAHTQGAGRRGHKDVVREEEELP